jgi:GTP-binding protein
MFIDKSTIKVKAGDGGRGCVAFRREKGVPHGGPSGGDGGAGGSIILRADAHLRTLIDFKFRPEYNARRGQHGLGSQCSGRNAEDMIVLVPPGTVVRDLGTGTVIADLVRSGQEAVVAKGGRGGRGNQHFATSTRQAPDWAYPGEVGEARTLELELRVIADVGLVGLPNAGKSLLLSKISAAHPQVAAWPFTTKTPELGVVSLGPNESFVVADLPGLIEGAHAGVGLGHEFLRHVSRTRILVHVIDVGTEKTAKELKHDHDVILDELKQYDPILLKRPRVLAGNKMDMPGAKARFDALAKHAKRRGAAETLPLSALTGDGIPRILRAMQKSLQGAPIPVLTVPEPPPALLTPRGRRRVSVVRDIKGKFIVRSRAIERAVAGAELGERKGLRMLQRQLTELGVDEALVRAGAKVGDIVQIGALEFEYKR